jgi:hypothetical protein
MWKRNIHTLERLKNKALFNKAPDFVSEEEIKTYKNDMLDSR